MIIDSLEINLHVHVLVILLTGRFLFSPLVSYLETVIFFENVSSRLYKTCEIFKVFSSIKIAQIKLKFWTKNVNFIFI